MFNQCSPPRKLWDTKTPGTCPHIRSKVNLGMACTSGSWGAMTDFCLALYPIYLVRSLQMRMRIKILVTALMGLGIFSATCSIIRTYYLKSVPATSSRTHDYTYYEWPLYFWASAEMWTILIASSLPPLWPLVQKVSRKVASTTPLRQWSRYAASLSRSSGQGRKSNSGASPSPLRSDASRKHVFRRLQDRNGGEHVEDDAIAMKTFITVEEEERATGGPSGRTGI